MKVYAYSHEDRWGFYISDGGLFSSILYKSNPIYLSKEEALQAGKAWIKNQS